ncbi:MAG: hydantoinase/oxoprolinase family protein [Desulfovibrio sp.]|uniref:hydantoinase/oxoprolinase family protein n=1 Tax=Desulfovibrio sp. 7SRBS1 TaxID=3378064 RepID=UPI003B41323D
MLLGIDVGGTHTDAVLIHDKGIAAAFKVPTNHDNLMESIDAVLDKVCADVDPASVERVNLSTTLTTNAIVEGKTDPVAVLVAGGPGVDPAHFKLCPDFHVLSGSTDHRGNTVASLNKTELNDAAQACAAKGIRAYAVVGKFSPRNPSLEQSMADAVAPAADVVTMGHELTGRLNFPRRIATAYFNSAAWGMFDGFARAISSSLKARGIEAKVNILKADGGTMPLSLARRHPVESILSGPAASVMGIISMCDIALDSIILDIGGTTTDIAVFASGAPLMEMDGISIGSHPTLVRALLTQSIGVGGDSALSVLGDEIHVGPRRLGPSLAQGGEHPTLIDAFIYLGQSDMGDVQRSKEQFKAFATQRSIRPETLAQRAVDRAVDIIVTASRQLVKTINSKPVYTIHELLEDARIVPKKVYVMGGPAKVFKEPLFKAFKLTIAVPEHHGVANAVGAALTRTTHNVELFADTERLRMHIPSIGLSKTIERDYDLDEAVRDARTQLLNHLRQEGIPSREENTEITHASSFNMIDGSHLAGRNIRVKCQIKPGILHRYKNLLGRLC